jgi:hypothetical protein
VTEEVSHGLVALAHLGKGDLERALAVADRVAMLSDASPTAWHVQLGYQAASEVFLTAWEQRRGDRSLEACARRAERVLDRCCRVLPIARAMSLVLRGRRAHLLGRARRAERLWRAAIEESTARDLPFELGRALYEWGSRLPREDARRSVMLRRSASTFGRIGAAHWHRRALSDL